VFTYLGVYRAHDFRIGTVTKMLVPVSEIRNVPVTAPRDGTSIAVV
jgi:hypothetical protein